MFVAETMLLLLVISLTDKSERMAVAVCDKEWCSIPPGMVQYNPWIMNAVRATFCIVMT